MSEQWNQFLVIKEFWFDKLLNVLTIIQWAYGKAGNGNEMETENGNWKPETEMKLQPLSCCSPWKIHVASYCWLLFLGIP